VRDESAPYPLFCYCAIWRNETNSFPRSAFLFSRGGEFLQQWDSALERSQPPAPSVSTAKQIVRSVRPQRVPRPVAFLQAGVLEGRTSSRATLVCVGLLLEFLEQALQTAEVCGPEA